MEPSKQTWLQKSIAAILDLIIVLGTLVLGFFIITGIIPAESKEIVMYLLGGLMALVSTVYNYHRGSSKESDK